MEAECSERIRRTLGVLSEKTQLSLINVRSEFCFIYWKYTFLFLKTTSLTFTRSKGHKLSLIFSRVVPSSRIKI